MSIRIRIKKAPKAQTGDQVGFGLFTNSRQPVGTVSEADDVKQTLSPVARHEANIEAERGEVAVGDFDQDGQLEHFRIGGERHSNGGTPLSVPEGTFIFSDTKKMALKGPILENFGKKNTSQKFTPAELAKQYDLNKYKKILQDPNSDKLDKDTAEMMIQNNQQKLGELALVQEAMKGFPNGIPDIALNSMEESEDGLPMARYGGQLPVFQTGSQFSLDEAKKRGKQVRISQIPENYEFIGTEGNRSYYGFGTPGSASVGTGRFKLQKAEPWIKQFAEKGVTYDELVRRKAILDTPEHKQIFDKYYKPLPGTTDYVFTERINIPIELPKREFSFKLPEPKLKPISIIPPPIKTTTEEEPPKDEVTVKRENMPWWTQDKINLAHQFMNRYNIRKYMPTYTGVNSVLPDPTFLDPTRQLAANQEQANTQHMMNTMYAGPQRQRANQSSISGQALNFAANTLGQVGQGNVGIANEFAVNRAQIRNGDIMLNAQARDNYLTRLATVNQQYDNAVAQQKEGVRMNLINGMNNAQKTYWLNKMNQQYNIDPRTGRINFMGGKDLNASVPGSGSQNQGIELYKQLYDQHYQLYKDPAKAHEWAMKFATGSKSRVNADDEGNVNYGFSGYGVNPLQMLSMYGPMGIPLRYPAQ